MTRARRDRRGSENSTGLFSGWKAVGPLEERSIDVDGVSRTFWVGGPATRPAPVLIVCHGSGMNGRNMAAMTGLGTRGPEAGFVTVFPDGWDEGWDGGRRLPRSRTVDDPAFIQAIVEQLIDEGRATNAVFLVGLSSGALFVEHVVRHGLISVAGVVLVAGATTVASRHDVHHPARPTAVICFEGTGDPAMPYLGGPIGGTGLIGWISSRRSRKRGDAGDSRVAVAVETVVGDWVAANGLSEIPEIEELVVPRGALPVTRLRWAAAGHKPVVLFRIEGGGHGWPGGPQFMPSRFIGPIARALDATGTLLELARLEVAASSDPTD